MKKTEKKQIDKNENTDEKEQENQNKDKDNNPMKKVATLNPSHIQRIRSPVAKGSIKGRFSD